MKGQPDWDHDPSAYGQRIADEYDDLYDGFFDTDTAVECLADLAGQGPVLELGIGTGRLALPLLARGLSVHGVDGSAEMVEHLRAKPAGTDIPVTIADFCDYRLADRFSMVFLAVNTIFALPTQDAQVSCFENAAHHLSPGGRFVVEAWIPDPARFTHGTAIGVRRLTADRVSLDIAQLEPSEQRMRTTQVSLRDGRVRLYPANHRYAWPSELDLMARIAGLAREHRWSGWDRSPFGDHSTAHVTVYRRMAVTPGSVPAGDDAG